MGLLINSFNFSLNKRLYGQTLIRVPDNLSSEISENKDVRVIVLLEEIENQDENDFMTLSKERFLAGYSDSDSIYDNY